MVDYKKIFLVPIATIIAAVAMAQEVALATRESKEGFMRSEGKIYVVAAVVLIILGGLLLYVARLDQKITKLEKRAHD
jgi:uncharacterized membrane protein